MCSFKVIVLIWSFMHTVSRLYWVWAFFPDLAKVAFTISCTTLFWFLWRAGIANCYSRGKPSFFSMLRFCVCAPNIWVQCWNVAWRNDYECFRESLIFSIVTFSVFFQVIYRWIDKNLKTINFSSSEYRTRFWISMYYFAEDIKT